MLALYIRAGSAHLLPPRVGDYASLSAVGWRERDVLEQAVHSEVGAAACGSMWQKHAVRHCVCARVSSRTTHYIKAQYIIPAPVL